MSATTQRLTVSWQDIEGDAARLATQLASVGRWHRIIAIVRGGMVPAGLLAQHLDVARIDTLSICRTSGAIQGPKAEEEGVLIVDELVDTGATIQAIRPHYPRAHVAVLYAKPAGRAMADSFIKEFPQSIWLEFPWEQDQVS